MSNFLKFRIYFIILTVVVYKHFFPQNMLVRGVFSPQIYFNFLGRPDSYLLLALCQTRKRDFLKMSDCRKQVLKVCPRFSFPLHFGKFTRMMWNMATDRLKKINIGILVSFCMTVQFLSLIPHRIHSLFKIITCRR